MKKMLFLLATAMIVMASCSKDDDPYNEPPVSKDSISVVISYNINTTLVYVDATLPNSLSFSTYYNGVYENTFRVKKGERFVMKGRDFEANFLGREIEIERIEMNVVISSEMHAVYPSSCTPTNPGRIPVTKNMVYSYCPTMTFVKWW